MGRVTIGEESSTPPTPTAGNTLFSTVATPSLFRLVDDAGGVYTVALLGKDQTFTETNIFAPAGTAATDRAIYIQMPAGSTAQALRAEYNALASFGITVGAAESQITFANRDLGNNIAGPFILFGRNTNAGAEGNAVGTIRIIDVGGTSYSIWPDDTGVLRIHTAAPTGSSGSPTVSDTAGTVVGTQTSWHELKQNIVERLTRDDLLDAVLGLRLYDFDMRGEHHTGLVIFEDDRDAWFVENAESQQIPALNERSLFGHLIGAIQAQQAQIEALTQRLTQLEARI